MATFRPGKYGAIKFGGVEYPLKFWRLDPQAAELDITNFDSPQDADGVVYGEFTAAVLKSNLEVRGQYPVGLNLWGGAVKFKPSLTVACFLGLTPLIGATVSLVITSAPIECDVDQVAGFQLRGRPTGLITWPTD